MVNLSFHLSEPQTSRYNYGKLLVMPMARSAFNRSEIPRIAYEQWLGSLTYARPTKSKLRNQLSSLYSHAIRYELWDKINPITFVRQSSKRMKIPDILSLAEMQAIVAGMIDPMHRIAILIAAVTGLRRSEIRGLKWSDVDFEGLWLPLERGVVRTLLNQVEGRGEPERGSPFTGPCRSPTKVAGRMLLSG